MGETNSKVFDDNVNERTLAPYLIKTDTGPLREASLDEPTTPITYASIYSEVDPMTGVSGRIMVGQSIPVETDTSEVALDPEKEHPQESNSDDENKVITDGVTDAVTDVVTDAEEKDPRPVHLKMEICPTNFICALSLGDQSNEEVGDLICVDVENENDVMKEWFGPSYGHLPRGRHTFIAINSPVVVLMSRSGGGNRVEYREGNLEATKYEGYYGNKDADFDYTYALFFYDIPTCYVNEWKEFISNLPQNYKKDYGTYNIYEKGICWDVGGQEQ